MNIYNKMRKPVDIKEACFYVCIFMVVISEGKRQIIALVIIL